MEKLAMFHTTYRNTPHSTTGERLAVTPATHLPRSGETLLKSQDG